MRFSILIPSYNHGRFVAAAVDSCLRQDYPREDFEIVVVDDGSTDESLKVLESYAAAGEIILIRQANSGQAAAFKSALAAPNANVLHPSKLIPTLQSEMAAGIHWLACAVAGDPCAQGDALPGLPLVTLPGKELRITDHAGGLLFSEPVA